MLLEHYDDYSQRAKLMTDIHARHFASKSEHSDDEGCSSSKKLASDKKIQDKKKEKLMKEKRKILKRLWGAQPDKELRSLDRHQQQTFQITFFIF